MKADLIINFKMKAYISACIFVLVHNHLHFTILCDGKLYEGLTYQECTDKCLQVNNYYYLGCDHAEWHPDGNCHTIGKVLYLHNSPKFFFSMFLSDMSILGDTDDTAVTGDISSDRD